MTKEFRSYTALLDEIFFAKSTKREKEVHSKQKKSAKFFFRRRAPQLATSKEIKRKRGNNNKRSLKIKTVHKIANFPPWKSAHCQTILIPYKFIIIFLVFLTHDWQKKKWQLKKRQQQKNTCFAFCCCCLFSRPMGNGCKEYGVRRKGVKIISSPQKAPNRKKERYRATKLRKSELRCASTKKNFTHR